jgi:hypothetical protein
VGREVLDREVSQMSPRVATSHSARPPAPPPPEDSTVVERRTVERPKRTSKISPKERQLVRILLHIRTNIDEAGESIGAEQLHDVALQDIYRALLAGTPDDSTEVLAARLSAHSVDKFNELLNEPIGEGEEVTITFAALVAYFRRTPVTKELRNVQREMPIAAAEEKDDILSKLERLRNEKNALGDRSFKGYGPARQS